MVTNQSESETDMAEDNEVEYITKADFLKRVEEIGSRYDVRIRNQIATINRILEGGTYDTEMATLHEQLAEATADLERLRREQQ